jgi:hypothetical protein
VVAAAVGPSLQSVKNTDRQFGPPRLENCACNNFINNNNMFSLARTGPVPGTPVAYFIAEGSRLGPLALYGHDEKIFIDRKA